MDPSQPDDVPPSLCLGDHIDQRTQERHDDQEDDPHRLPPAAEILITEQVDDDLEQHDQIAAETKAHTNSQMKSEKLFTRASVARIRPEYCAVGSLGTSLSRGEFLQDQLEPSGYLSAVALVDMGEWEAMSLWPGQASSVWRPPSS